MLAVELKKALLVGARRVKHQMPKAERDIGHDLVDMLVRIVGNDPAARRALNGKRGGKAFDFGGIFDRGFLLRK